MAIEACLEGAIRLIAIMLRTLIDHWGLTVTFGLGTLVFLYVVNTYMKVMGGSASLVAGIVSGLGLDITDFITDITEAFGGASAIIGGIVVGIGFPVMLIFFSRVNIVLKILGAPIFFVLGIIIGVLPIPTWGTLTFMAVALQFKTISDIVVGLMVVLVLLAIMLNTGPLVLIFLWLFGDSVCGTINHVSTLLV